MPIHQDSFIKNLKLLLDNNPQLYGLSALRKRLEKDFFSDVTIRDCSPDADRVNLIIELDSNLSLVEVLYHLQQGIWGDMHPAAGSGHELRSLGKVISQLRELNTAQLDIEEFSIFLSDSSVTIKRIYEHSVITQLANILNAIAEHYVHLTKKLTETPSEIYIPVFEEHILESGDTLSHIKTEDNCCAKDYFRFWGLYFDSEEDAVIYDLSSKSIISGDLYMLSHS